MDPATAGSVEEAAPGVTVDDVERAVIEAFGVTGRAVADDALLAEAAAIAAANAL